MFAGILLAAVLTTDWSQTGLSFEFVTRMAAGPGSQPRLYAFATSGLYRSDDGGSTWQRKPGLLASVPIGLAVDPNDPDRVFVADLFGGFSGYTARLLVSDDGGETWTEKLSVRDATSCSIAVDPVFPGGVYVSFGGIPRFFRSDDGGATFADLPAPSLGGLLAVAADGTLISVTGSVFVSHDRGLNWALVSSPHQPCPILAVATDPVDPLRWYAGVGANNDCGLVSRTDDGGASWTVVSDFHMPVIFLATDTGTVYASVGLTVPTTLVPFQVFSSTDGGSAWIDLGSPAPGFGFILVPRNGRSIYASTRAGVYRRGLRRTRALVRAS
jgi:hypothetical protein